MRSIRISLPEFPYIRYLYYAFLKLIDSDKADIRVSNNAVEILAKGEDIRPVLSSAIEYAVELGKDYTQRRFRVDFPMSGNDKKIFRRLLNELGLSEQDMLTVLKEYASRIKEININELQEALEYGEGGFSPFQAFLLETYSLTRAPFFNSDYKHELRMSLHQMMICTTGYIAVRCNMSRIGDDNVAVLVLPLNLKVTRYDFYRMIRNSVVGLLGMSSEEAVILWIALHLPDDFSEDILVLGVKEPGQSMTPISSITISNEFLLRATRLSILREHEDNVRRLLRYALIKGSRSQPEVDDAIEYVKLLYLAIQKGYEREIYELALRSSRREASLASTSSQDDTIRNRKEIARRARIISSTLLNELG